VATPLPIDDCLGEIRSALSPGTTVLLQAPPGAGKTTRVPLALLETLAGEGSILMLEPRRLAARAAAERLAADLGETVGQRVGYRVRLESRTSSITCLEVQTAGVFLRRLQSDPCLEGVACVIFDEFHERHAEGDLALALVRQARDLLCLDLRLLVMSATLDLAPLARQLGADRVITSKGRSHSVQVEYQPPRPGEPLVRQVLRGLEQHWLDERESGETVLVFLPGQREILATQRAIEATDWGYELECCPLHGELPLAAQGRAIARARSATGKVVLATAIAESSLTIEGVALVIDSGLRRLSRFDPATGMDGLVTQPASQASAEQRRGRAGRLAPGRCLRLWSPAEQGRPSFDLPELMEADPLPIALQLAEWGSGLGEDLPWLQPPPRVPLQEAQGLLADLGAIEGPGTITAHGRALARLGLHPRLGHMLLRAQTQGWLELGCALAVLLSERDPLDRRVVGCDLLPRLDQLRQSRAGPEASSGDHGATGRPWRQLRLLEAQLRRRVQQASREGVLEPGNASGKPPSLPFSPPDERAAIVARLVSWAYPERLALGRGRGDGRFLLRSGRGALLPAKDPLATAAALAVACVDGQGMEARILLAVAMPPAVLEEITATEAVAVREARWDEDAQKVRCEHIQQLGALVLHRRPWPDAQQEAVLEAMLHGLGAMGLEALPWCSRSRRLQQRLALAHSHLGAPWPDRRSEVLEQELASWLGPHLGGIRSRKDLQQLDLWEALWGELPWERRQELAQWLPEELPVPSGRRVPIDYASGEPVLAVKLQEMFGASHTPHLLQGLLPVTVQLLSPAGRPVAITRDLAGFWDQGYAVVRRELRGRYPKHPWPEDPRQAPATGLTNAGLRRASPA
jgi:ATP-dependent helicase HrpB